MANQQVGQLDACFRALAHPIRRAILQRLQEGPQPVGAISASFDVAAPTISKHLIVLEDAGLIFRQRIGREHRLTLDADPMFDAVAWMTDYHRFWNQRFDALEALIDKLDNDPQHSDPTKTDPTKDDPTTSNPSRPDPNKIRKGSRSS